MADVRIAVIWIHNPPLNTLNRETRIKLWNDLQRAIDNPVVELIVLVGSGRSFSVGADIKELALPWALGEEKQVMKAYVDAYHTHNLAPLAAMIDSSPKPVVCLINGEAWGGGLELAMACHYRVCTSRSTLRFPEVLIGIIPGALGTQFTPRLTNFNDCLQLCVACKTYGAKEALTAGIIDQIIPETEGDSNTTMSYLRRMLLVLHNQLDRGKDASHPFRRTSTLPVRTSLKDAMRLSHLFAMKYPHYVPLPHKGGEASRGAIEALIACVRAGPAFEKGALAESELSKTLVVSPQAQALRYVFMAEREATKVVFARDTHARQTTSESSPSRDGHIIQQRFDELLSGPSRSSPFPSSSSSSSKPMAARAALLDVRTVGVVGSGVMGSGIAAAFLMAGGFQVILVDSALPALARAKVHVQGILASAVRRGRMPPPPPGKALLHRLSLHTDFACLSACDLVVEAVFEDLAVKRQVFRQLDRVCKPTCLLASNTSSLDIDHITSTASSPSSSSTADDGGGLSPARGEYLFGMHFFTPAHLMKLVEVVVCKVTSSEVLEAAVAVTKRLGKIGIVVSNFPGFVANRCVFPYFLESMMILEDFAISAAAATAIAAQEGGSEGGVGGGLPLVVTVGCVDEAIRDFGFAMGPFQMADLSGLDVGYRIRKEKHLVDNNSDNNSSSSSSSSSRSSPVFKQRPLALLLAQGPRYSRIGDILYGMGRLGVKSGKGFYDYYTAAAPPPGLLGNYLPPFVSYALRGVVASMTSAASREVGVGIRGRPPVDDPVVLEVVRRERLRKGMWDGSADAVASSGSSNGNNGGSSSSSSGGGGDTKAAVRAVIQQRLLYPLVNEAFRLLGEGGVPSDRPGDVDIIFLRGYGWPAYTGGPLFWADRIVTLPVLWQRLQALSDTFPTSSYYTPAPLLTEMVKRKVSVLDLQANPSLVAALMRSQVTLL